MIFAVFDAWLLTQSINSSFYQLSNILYAKALKQLQFKKNAES